MRQQKIDPSTGQVHMAKMFDGKIVDAIVTTMDTIPGKNITKIVGLVLASKNTTNISDVEAELGAEAERMGGNAVVAVKLAVMSDYIMTLVGTAVVVE